MTDLNWTGWPILTGESSHCKKEEALSCTPTGPSGKSFGVRSLEHSAFLFPTDKGDKSYGHQLEVDPSERLPGSVLDALKDDLLTLTKTRRSEVADIVWPPPRIKPGETQADNSETEMLKSLGYIDADE